MGMHKFLQIFTLTWLKYWILPRINNWKQFCFILVISILKAYIEITRKAADSMVKFYTCFPISMDGNQLLISVAPENMNIKDEVTYLWDFLPDLICYIS